MTKQLVEIHTSDRQAFKRCRRRFSWGSTLGQNLIRIGPEHSAFFLGTGFHFALEDWWGYRRFAHPALAFAAYYDAQKKDDLPDEAEDVLELAAGMLSYYVEDWLAEHPEPFETLIVDGKPQVEVEIAVSLDELLIEVARAHQREWLDDFLDANTVEYVITFDRAVIDKHDRIKGLDYKTAASFDELNLQTNPQAGSYDWAGSLFYEPLGFTFDGMIWQQHKKAVPAPPKWVNAGKKNEGFSLSFDQSTTFRLYEKALRDQYGKRVNWPDKYQPILGMLASAQSHEGDRFVRRDILRRNQQQRETEQEKIVQEVLEMLDPNLPMYPNPTADCKWDCPFRAPCLATDDGSDVQFILDNEYEQWAGYKDAWRTRIKWPTT